ncbi:N-acetylneuraminate synthase [Synechococcus sp. CC9902]|uniref:N-acetylneuraminate synthase family protein n=1 Tax=Synechococcus sp. (strain CC9902) TaxID=316279 RepID=UPI00005D3CED|nr:N-acetylneuraminate synthase family protein [Synechococcus sp. CC9902]ABB25059.1 N-acetylneuraminate synthase [Synechococcus sp. CC9902]
MYLFDSDNPLYFIADIGANHDSSLKRAKALIKTAAESGADAAKFQNFFAHSIVSDLGFKQLPNSILSHQAEWTESVFDVYDKASLSLEWTEELHSYCKECGISYMTTPYDISILEFLNQYVACWKIGSGDITWLDLISKVSQLGKPIAIATGASNFTEVCQAVNTVLQHTKKIILMQCNTNYTGCLSNFDYLNLSVLTTYKNSFPGITLGISDHTPGHISVLGAITLGAQVIEKHFTDDNNRKGPDHSFSMSPSAWESMVEASYLLHRSIGDGVKRIEDNEINPSIVQRRAIRANCDIEANSIIQESMVEFLRPCPKDALAPSSSSLVVGHRTSIFIPKGETIKLEYIF